MEKKLRLNVEIKGRPHNFKLLSTVKIRDFLSIVASDFKLPTLDAENQKLNYGLYLRNSNTGLPLQENISLKEAGLRSFDYLIVKEISEKPVSKSMQVSEIQHSSATFSSELEALASVNRNLILNTLAQDRTTHAIRSILRFMAIQLSSAISSGLLWGASYGNINEVSCAEFGSQCTPDGRLQALAVGSVIGAFIYTFWAVRREFKKSEVPD